MIQAFQSVTASTRFHRAASAAGGFFHLRLNDRTGYNSASPRTGKLRATREPFRKFLTCQHRSNEKARPAVSCVGLACGECRDAAIQPRRLRERPCLTNTNDASASNKARQRRPATWWAIRRKACAKHRTMRTNDPHPGLTELAVVRVDRPRLPHGSKSNRRTRPRMARHGGGAQGVFGACDFVPATGLVLCNWPSHRKPAREIK